VHRLPRHRQPRCAQVRRCAPPGARARAGLRHAAATR
jgi:hypothetical protein